MKLNAKQVAEVLAGYEELIREKIFNELIGIPTQSLRDYQGHFRVFVRYDAVRKIMLVGNGK